MSGEHMWRVRVLANRLAVTRALRRPGNYSAHEWPELTCTHDIEGDLPELYVMAMEVGPKAEPAPLIQ